MADVETKMREQQALDALKNKDMALSFTSGSSRKGAITTLLDIGWDKSKIVKALRKMKYVDAEIEGLLGITLDEGIDFQGTNLTVTKLVPFIVRPYNSLKGDEVQGDDLPWPENVYDRPDGSNLKDYVKKYNNALLPGGENNDKLKMYGSGVLITRAELVDRRTNGIMATYELDDSEVKQLKADIPGFYSESDDEVNKVNRKVKLERFADAILAGTNFVNTADGRKTREGLLQMLMQGTVESAEAIMNGEKRIDTTQGPMTLEDVKKVMGVTEDDNYYMPANDIVVDVTDRVRDLMAAENHSVDINAVGSVIQIYGEAMNDKDEATVVADKVSNFVRALISEYPHYRGMDYAVQWGKGTLDVSLNTQHMRGMTEKFDTVGQLARGKVTPAEMFPITFGIHEGGEKFLKEQIQAFAENIIERFGEQSIRAIELAAAKVANMFKQEFKYLQENMDSDNRSLLETAMAFDRRKPVFRRLESLSGSRNIYADLRNSKISD